MPQYWKPYFSKARRVIEVNNPQNRRQGCEMVIGNFRLRIAHDRKERRLADIREADKSHIRNYLELELDFNLSGRCPGCAYFGACMVLVA